MTNVKERMPSNQDNSSSKRKTDCQNNLGKNAPGKLGQMSTANIRQAAIAHGQALIKIFNN